MERGWNEGGKPAIDQALRKRSIRIFEYTRFLYRVASQFLSNTIENSFFWYIFLFIPG